MLKMKENKIDITIIQKYLDKYINSKAYKEYLKCGASYDGYYDILDTQKPNWQPNNKLVNNFAKNITDTFSGFVVGNGVAMSGANDEILEFNKRNGIATKNMEAISEAIKFGVAYELLYQDEYGQTKNAILSPLNSFVVYSNTIEPAPKMFVRWQNCEGELIGEVYTKDKVYEFSGQHMTIDSLNEKQDNLYIDIPVVIWQMNKSQRSIFIDQLSDINAYNKISSNKVNDIESFSDAYLVMKDIAIQPENEEETMQDAVNRFVDNIRNSHVMLVNSVNDMDGAPNNSSVEFITKPSDDASQEHALDRLERQIYGMSSVVNFNNETFGNSSGVALQLRLQPMRNLMKAFVNLAQFSLYKRYELMCSLPIISNKEAWKDLTFKFTENVPTDIKSEAEALAILETTVSKETALSRVSFIENVDEELEKINEENKQREGLY